MKKIQILGAGAFVAFALVFGASQVFTPTVSAAQTGYGCCNYAQDCAGGMQCTGPTTNCPAATPPYKGSCVAVTPGPQTPIAIPGPLS